MSGQWNFICVNGHSNIFDDLHAPPSQCAICAMDYDSDFVRSTSLDGIVLICQKTAGEIPIPNQSSKIILGREGVGAEVLSRLLNEIGQPVISREHCSITFHSQMVTIKDENSMNGTYVGEQKISCKSSPQIIHHDQFIFLGRERFLVQFQYTGVEKAESAENAESANIGNGNILKSHEAKPMNLSFTCRICATVYEQKHDICPNCDSYQSMMTT